jgi:hypothetical protein
MLSEDTKYKVYIGVAVFLLALGVPIADLIMQSLGL